VNAPITRTASRLERLGLNISPIGFGSAPIGGLYESIPEATARAAIRAALQGGINLFDTAPSYSLGFSEQRLGAALKNVPRESYVLESKVGRLLEDGGLKFDLTPSGLERSLESSLKRLGVSRLEIVLLHDPDDHEITACETALPSLLEWRDQGLVRAIGMGMNQWQMPLRLLEQFDLDIIMVAGRYTLLEQAALPLLDACAERDVAVFAAGVFNSGILASGAIPGAKHNYATASPEIMARVQRLEMVCAGHGVTLNAAAVQFVLAHPAVVSAVLGMSTELEVHDNLTALQAHIPQAFWQELQDIGWWSNDFIPPVTQKTKETA
jgi:D-threo-aldose 1-dehydrogenase